MHYHVHLGLGLEFEVCIGDMSERSKKKINKKDMSEER